MGDDSTQTIGKLKQNKLDEISKQMEGNEKEKKRSYFPSAKAFWAGRERLFTHPSPRHDGHL